MFIISFSLIAAGLAWMMVKPAWRPKLGRQLKSWASEPGRVKQAALDTHLPEETLHFNAWLGGLSDDQADDFARDLAVFCRSRNLDLAWLFDPNAAAEIKAVLQDVATLYGMAIYRGQELQPLILLQAWQADPHRPAHRAFARALYVRLMEAGLASAPAGLLLASDKARYAHMIQAIQSAATHNRSTVVSLVAELRSERTANRPATARAKQSQKQTAARSALTVARAVEISA